MTMGSDARFPALGRSQRMAVVMLADQGYWRPGVPWGLGTDTTTGRVMASLGRRGMAAFDRAGLVARDDRWVLTTTGWAWLIACTALDLRGLSADSDAWEQMTERIGHLASCARLSRYGPVNWRGDRV
jgi:hypothetical protein